MHVLRTLADAEALRDELLPGARLAIVGGGFVGAEVASTARSLGVDVTLLEAGSAPFERALGPELGARLADRYRDHGVDIRTETAAAGFRETSAGRVDAVILTDGTVIESRCRRSSPSASSLRTSSAAGAEPPIYACGDNAGSRRPLDRRRRGGRSRPPGACSGSIRSRGSRRSSGPISSACGCSSSATPRHADEVEVEGSQDSFVARYRASGGKLVAALASNRPADVGRLRLEVATAA